MKYIKRIDEFNRSIYAASEDDISFFYSCDGCDSLFKDLKGRDKCKSCESSEIEELSKDEFKEIVKTRLNKDEIEDMELDEFDPLLLDLKYINRYVN